LVVAILSLRETTNSAARIMDVTPATLRLEQIVLELETGQRGVVLANDARFLVPLQAACADLPGSPTLDLLPQPFHHSRFETGSASTTRCSSSTLPESCAAEAVSALRVRDRRNRRRQAQPFDEDSAHSAAKAAR
jgi:hypothetical protein